MEILIKVKVPDDAIIISVTFQTLKDLNSMSEFERMKYHSTINFQELHLPTDDQLWEMTFDEGEDIFREIAFRNMKKLIGQLLKGGKP